VVGIMVGSGIFRTPGVVAAALGRPWLTFVAWVLGGVIALAISGTFEQLLGLAVTLVLVIDGATALALVRLRRRAPGAPFSVPAFPLVASGFLAVYAALLVTAAIEAPWRSLVAGAVLAGAALVSVARVPARRT